MNTLAIPREKRINIHKARLLAPFSRKYRFRCGLASIAEPLRVAYTHSAMTTDGRFVFVKNSKAGCTSITQLLYRYSTGDFRAERVHVATDGILQGLTHWRQYHQHVGQTGTTCFTFVRNPEARLRSCFFNVLVDQSNRATRHHMPPLASRGFDDGRSLQWNFDVFLDYVAESLEVNPTYCDRHWRAQHINIAHGHLAYDLIGRLENYAADIRRLFEIAGREGFLTDEILKARFNRSSKSELEINAQARRRIELLYARDYELFGY